MANKQMLTFHVPFDGKTDMDVMLGHAEGPVPSVRHIVPECPAQLDALVKQLLAKDPNERPSSAAETHDSLERILRGDSTSFVGSGQVAASDESEAGDRERPNLTARLKSTKHSAGDQVSWGRLAAIGLIIVAGLVIYVVANQ